MLCRGLGEETVYGREPEKALSRRTGLGVGHRENFLQGPAGSRPILCV